MNRSFALGALLSILGAASAAHADSGRTVERDGVVGREHRLPLCYGNNVRVDTMLRPGGFTSLRCLPTRGGEYCSWFIGTSGTRPTHDYLIVARTPSVPESPPPIPDPPTSIVALGAVRAAAGGPVPAPARLTWPTGTIIPALRSSACAPAWTADHDSPRGASLVASPADGDLVFALDAGRSSEDGSEVIATAEVGSCTGSLAIQDDGDGGTWRDVVATPVVAASGYRSYRLSVALEPGHRVRLALRATGTCSVRSVDVFLPMP